MSSISTLYSAVVAIYITKVKRKICEREQPFITSTLDMNAYWPYSLIDSNNDPQYFMFPFCVMKTDSLDRKYKFKKYFIQKFKPELNSTQTALVEIPIMSLLRLIIRSIIIRNVMFSRRYRITLKRSLV